MSAHAFSFAYQERLGSSCASVGGYFFQWYYLNSIQLVFAAAYQGVRPLAQVDQILRDTAHSFEKKIKEFSDGESLYKRSFGNVGLQNMAYISHCPFVLNVQSLTTHWSTTAAGMYLMMLSLKSLIALHTASQSQHQDSRWSPRKSQRRRTLRQVVAHTMRSRYY